jgi:hypothetical protein
MLFGKFGEGILPLTTIFLTQTLWVNSRDKKGTGMRFWLITLERCNRRSYYFYSDKLITPVQYQQTPVRSQISRGQSDHRLSNGLSQEVQIHWTGAGHQPITSLNRSPRNCPRCPFITDFRTVDCR